MTETAIKLERVTKAFTSYDGQQIVILNQLDLTIKVGEFVAIVGESGSGKSTLLNIIALLDKNYQGHYQLMGQEVSRLSDSELSRLRKEKVGFIFQDFLLMPNLTVRENVALQSEYLDKGERKQANQEYVDYLLDQVGLTDKQNQYPRQLSGGQKQRVAIARALLNRPAIIFADEPTGALDEDTSETIMKLLKTFNQKGHTLVMVTHDLHLADQADRKLLVVNQNIKEVKKDADLP
ncbi:MAG TPA: ABC transporter ATP-binding protein [Candidatus Limosilactobacillus faecipullorum]|nr:ABC transporter ATP-binding protein [Candidatus Limosilactobacillus faecipullorum]